MIKRVLTATAVLGLIAVVAVAMKSTINPPLEGSAEQPTVNEVVLATCTNCEACECDGACDGKDGCCASKTCCEDAACCSEEQSCSDGKCSDDALACSCEACECDDACNTDSQCCVNQTCCADGKCCQQASDDGLPAGIIDLGIDLTPKGDAT